MEKFKIFKLSKILLLSNILESKMLVMHALIIIILMLQFNH